MLSRGGMPEYNSWRETCKQVRLPELRAPGPPSRASCPAGRTSPPPHPTPSRSVGIERLLQRRCRTLCAGSAAESRPHAAGGRRARLRLLLRNGCSGSPSGRSSRVKHEYKRFRSRGAVSWTTVHRASSPVRGRGPDAAPCIYRAGLFAQFGGGRVSERDRRRRAGLPGIGRAWSSAGNLSPEAAKLASGSDRRGFLREIPHLLPTSIRAAVGRGAAMDDALRAAAASAATHLRRRVRRCASGYETGRTSVDARPARLVHICRNFVYNAISRPSSPDW
jgi:hypothetical protein